MNQLDKWQKCKHVPLLKDWVCVRTHLTVTPDLCENCRNYQKRKAEDIDKEIRSFEQMKKYIVEELEKCDKQIAKLYEYKKEWK